MSVGGNGLTITPRTGPALSLRGFDHSPRSPRAAMAAPCAALSFPAARPLRAAAALLPTSPGLHLRVLPPFPPRSATSRRGLAAWAARASSAAFSSPQHEAAEAEAPEVRTPRWKPMCLYYTQGKCTMMNDSSHLEKFNHNFFVDLRVDTSKLRHPCSQDLDYLLILDLEGRVEILEFPVVVLDARTAEFVDAFHRFVRPSQMDEERTDRYIEGKYGKLGVDRVWHDTAITFKEVLKEFEIWLTHHKFWENGKGGSLHRAAFVTCGNWDLKTKIPEQCKDSAVKLPSYFMEWINLKDIYLNFYKRRATGMKTMMRELNIPLLGSHHLGIDDSKNIARVLQHMIADGAFMQITARRRPSSPNVEFLFEDRIR
ncbi:hypothetical protein Taro_036588 [Colocasia esculenta]|uniref:Exonuclease domain-containing protein n=1 Tax=Colocasia esculenta TaxID=4460 RepID=A0A843WIA5_COLES|nr:hypothetical protein [Colocasia esculenta]